MTKKRPTIGANPLDSLIPTMDIQQETQQQQQGSKREQDSKKERLTVHISPELISRARNAVFWTPGLTLASLAEEAIAVAIDRMEEERGEPFPERAGKLRTGRPVG